MKDDNIKNFFDRHKQKIEDEGFSERLFATLDCLPAPKPKRDNSMLVIGLSALAGFILFLITGGYQAVIDGLVSASGATTDIKLLTPEVIISLLFTGVTLFFIGKYALESD